MQLLKAQGTDAWHEAREGRITASLAAACLGLHPKEGPLAAYNQIMGLRKKSVNRHMQRGLDAEPLAIHAYSVKTGLLTDPGGFWVHDSLPFIGASPDVLCNDDGVAEIKAPEFLPESIPPFHEIQMRVQLAVTGRAWADFFAWTPNGHLLLRIHRNAEIEKELLNGLSEFYRRHILPKEPPPRRRKKVTDA